MCTYNVNGLNEVEYNSRRTRGADVYRRQCGVSERMPVLCANDEVAKSGRTGMITAYTEDKLSRERTMDCIMHRLLGENTIVLGARHELEAR